MKRNAIHLLFALSLLWLQGCVDDNAETDSKPVNQIASQVSPVAQQGQAGTRSTSANPEKSCSRILIDASRDGGVWWFPQGTPFNKDANHQGLAFEKVMTELGFEVEVLPRGAVITDDLLKEYSVIFRANAFGNYLPSEIEAYKNALDRGIILLLFSDHQTNTKGMVDGVANLAGVRFNDTLKGNITNFSTHQLTQGLSNLPYGVGSYIDLTQNVNFTSLATLEGKPVMGLITHPQSSILVMGDTNTIEFNTRPLTDNVVAWINANCKGGSGK
jgi:hypothetical protein